MLNIFNFNFNIFYFFFKLKNKYRFFKKKILFNNINYSINFIPINIKNIEIINLKKKQFTFNSKNNEKNWVKNFIINKIKLKNNLYYYNYLKKKYKILLDYKTKFINIKFNWNIIIKKQRLLLNNYVSSSIFNLKNFFKLSNFFINNNFLFLNKIYTLLFFFKFIKTKYELLNYIKNKFILINTIYLENLNYFINNGDCIRLFCYNKFLKLYLINNFKKIKNWKLKQKFLILKTNINFKTELLFLKNFEINYYNLIFFKILNYNNLFFNNLFINNVRLLNWRTYNWLN